MAASYPSVAAAAAAEALVYAAAVPPPPLEGDIGNPLTVPSWARGCTALLAFVAQGPIASQTSWAAIQTDAADGNWVDLATVLWAGTVGKAVFLLSAGFDANGGLLQSRAAGSAPPAGVTVNQVGLMARVRVVAKTALGSASSSSSPSAQSGVPPAVLLSVFLRLPGLR